MSGRPTDRPDQSLPRQQRMRRRGDFLRSYRSGHRRHGEYVILYAVANGLEHPRLGVTVSRKVGNAVARHRAKRRIREIYRRWSQRPQLPPMDFMLQAKPTIGGAPFGRLQSEIERLLATWLTPASGDSSPGC